MNEKQFAKSNKREQEVKNYHYIVEYNGSRSTFGKRQDAYNHARFVRNTYRCTVYLYKAEIVDVFGVVSSNDVDLFTKELWAGLEESYQLHLKNEHKTVTLDETTSWDIYYTEIHNIVENFFKEKGIPKQDLDWDVDENGVDIWIWGQPEKDFKRIMTVEWYV